MSTCKHLVLTSACAAMAFASSAGAAERSWTNSSGGDWSTPANWSDTLVPTASDSALFDLNSTYPVTLSNDVSVNALNVSAGSVSFASADSTARQLTTGSLLLGTGGKVKVASGGRVTANTYLVNAGSSIDIGQGGTLQVSGFVAGITGTLRADLAAGYNGGDWQGAGITSSYAQSHPAIRVGYHYHDISAALIDVKLTLSGDASLDGRVNFDDLLIVAKNYERTDTIWQSADYDYNGVTAFDDLLEVAQAYGSTLLSSGEITRDEAMASAFDADWAQARSLVPEPASLGLVAAGLLVGRRRRA